MKHLLPLLVLWLSTLPLQAQAEPGHARAWQHESSDIPADPRIHFGHLDNGMRFAWLANPEPDKRCYLRLHIDVGSLAEEDHERGMAHFVEHMAFNGTTHFAAGELVDWFQKHGMDFGADTNAYTSFSQTVYMLDLPTSDEKSLCEGLTVLRDFADGILFEPKEIEAEKGVVDAEDREAESAMRRLVIKNNELLYDGTRIPLRDPIGVKDARDLFDEESLRKFYAKWYRPENATLIVAGDLGDVDPEAFIRRQFADWKAPQDSAAREPDLGTPSLKHRYFSINEAEIPYYVIGINRVDPHEDQPLTVARLVGELPLRCARAMLNLRLRELAKKEAGTFLQAFAVGLASPGQASPFPQVFRGESLNIVATPGKWEQALRQCDQELRRTLEHGFQDAELGEVRADILRGLQEAVQREDTRASQRYATALLQAAEHRVVPMNAATRREIFKSAVETLTAQECHEAFARAWSQGTLLLGGGGNLDLGEAAGTKLLAVYEAGRKADLEAPEKIEVGQLAFASAGKVARIAARRHVEDLDIHLIDFDNGVRVAIKKTDFKEREIRVRAYLGEGSLTLDPSAAATSMVGTSVFDQAGLGSHSEDELRRLTAGKRAGVSMHVADDAFVLGGPTTSEDLQLQCQLMCAYLTDPGWRAEGLRQFRKGLTEYYESLDRQHTGPLLLDFMPALYSGDIRFGLPSRESVEVVSMDDLKEWLVPHLSAAPLAVCFVGDLEVDETAEAALQTFGLLPSRRPLERLEERRKIRGPVSGLDSRYEIETESDKSTIILAFPTTDGMELTTRVRLDFLGRIVADRLLESVREKLGASYSPYANAQSSTVFPGDGLLMVRARSAPDAVDSVIEACLSVTDELAAKGVTEEEVDRLREPVLAQLRDRLRENGYWVYTLLDSMHGRPQALDESRRELNLFRAVSAEDLTPLAAEYLERKRASLFVASPKDR